ncbi:hypothetical protein ACFLYN_04835 [Chloroflexota bacterium]
MVIFAGSYPQIRNALYIATHSSSNVPITIVVPGHHDLFQFFQVVNEKVFNNNLNLIYFKTYQPRRVFAKGLKKVLFILSDIIGERRYLKELFDEYFAELKGLEIYFSSKCYCPYTYYLMKRLSKRNKLIHITDPSMDERKVEKFIPKNIIDLARLIISKLIYGRDIIIGKISYTNFLCMSDSFYNREIDRVIDREERDEMMKDFDIGQYKISDAGDYSVIYFDEGLLETDYIRIDKNTFRRELADIFRIILKYFPEEKIARKYHPGYPGDKTVIEVGDELPDFIPAELLYNDNVKLYLSGFSLSIANVEKGLAVSIADLITIQDEEIKNSLRELLIQKSKSEILFPKSLDEFERILIGTKQSNK